MPGMLGTAASESNPGAALERSALLKKIRRIHHPKSISHRPRHKVGRRRSPFKNSTRIGLECLVLIFISLPNVPRYCPAPDCGYAVIASGCSKCPIIQCGREECATLFCYHCQQNCTAEHKCRNGKRASSKVKSTRKLSKKSRQSKSTDKPDGKKGAKLDEIKTDQIDDSTASIGSSSGESVNNPTATTEFLNRFNMKRCPSCRILIIKIEDGSCNHMTCSVCGTQFCWLCIKKTSELHYLSPTGCTFFGKRQWSKKKKMVWQFGMLLGAPVFILLSGKC